MGKEMVLKRFANYTTYIFYSDYTYCCENWGDLDCSRWKVEGENAFLRHEWHEAWQDMGVSGSFCELAKEAKFNIGFNEQVERELLSD